MSIFGPFFSKITAIIFPNRCISCKKEGILICQSCSISLKPRSPACFVCNSRSLKASVCPSCRKYTVFTHFYAPFSYAAKTPRELVHRLKYRFVTKDAEYMGRRIAQALLFYKVRLPKNAILAPIPLHRSRELARGFNQSELIAQSIASHLNLPISTEALARTQKTKPQVQCASSDERVQNVENAFRVLDATDIFGKHVLLVDDVATTGATLTEASKALKRAGAKSVWALTFAK